MGYTHYFQLHSEPSELMWNALIRGVEQIVAHSPAKLEIALNDKHITINGVGEDSHETFFIERYSLRWNFCKTARKPYDEAVTEVLILMRYLFDDFSLSSDGTWEDWSRGRELFTKLFHLEPSESTVFGNDNHSYEWKGSLV